MIYNTLSNEGLSLPIAISGDHVRDPFNDGRDHGLVA